MFPARAASAAIVIDLPDEAATCRLGRRIAAVTRKGDVIALWGDLGSGKTTLARALIRAIPVLPGSAGDDEVPSPTFTLVQTYPRAPAEIWHFDLFRIEQAEDVYELGIEEALDEGIALIEWPERMAALLPEERLDVKLRFPPGREGRTAILIPGPGWEGRLKEAMGHE